jgi:osmotically-inducible protein OsmY
MTTPTGDSDLQKAVMQELAWDTRIDETAIGVSVHHGVVTLNGVVGSWAAKHAAEEAAHRVARVHDVANAIEIKPSWSTKHSDADIAEAVRHALAWDVFIPERQIQSTVSDDGHVTLTGTVGTLRQRDDAERAVSQLEGVRLVTNQIAIEPPAVAAAELRGSIKQALARHVAREVERIAIDVQGDTVVLSGRVGSWTERQAVVGVAKGTPGVRRIDDQLQIEP